MSERTPTTDGLTVAPTDGGELSRHCYWGRYAGAANLPNASGNAASGPAYAALQPGDTAFDTSTLKLCVCQDKGTSGGADALWQELGTGGVVGTGMRLVWEWNETDLTQFDAVGDAGWTASVTTWNTRFPTWNQETPAIQFDNPATSGGWYGLLVKNSELDLSAYADKSLFFTWQVANQTSPGTQDPIFVPYYEDDTHFLAIIQKSLNFIFTRRDGSTSWTDGTDPLYNHVATGVGGDSALFGMRYRQFASALANPLIVARSHAWAYNYYYGVTDHREVQWALQSALSGTWQTLGAYQPRFGIGGRSYGTAASPGNIHANLRVFAYE